MLKQLKSTLLTVIFLVLAPAVIAQGTCPTLVEAALDAADELCAETGRNQACYGHFAIEAVPQADVSAFAFEKVGDIADVSRIETLRLQPMDENNQAWGIAILRLQANLPGTLPGQNVTFLLFGDVEITNEVAADGDDEYTPMQAFLLRTGLGDSQCDDAPESGLMVQTPEGAGEVTFNINGVDVGMGSTVLFQAAADSEMVVKTIEGAAVLEFEDDVQAVVEGTQLRVPLDHQLRPNQRLPHPPEPYEEGRVNRLPIHLLQRPIEIRPPLTGEQVAGVIERVDAGEPICGEGPLPSCDRVPDQLVARARRRGRVHLEDQLACVFRRDTHEMPLPGDETRPFCDELPPDNLPCVFLPGPGDSALPDNETRPPCPQLPEQSPPNIANRLPVLRQSLPPNLNGLPGELPPPPPGTGDGSYAPPPPSSDGNKRPRRMSSSPDDGSESGATVFRPPPDNTSSQ